MPILAGKARHYLPGIILIVLLCALIYGQTLGFDFLNLDDNIYITLNPVMRDGLTWLSVKWSFLTFNSPYYMPITRLSYLIDASIYGIQPWGFHLTNLILHIVNSILIVYLCRLLSGHMLFSSLVGLVFAVHPQHIEAFVWIAERKEVLSTMFGLLSLIFYVRHIKQLQAHEIVELHNKYYLLACLTFLLSLMAKPMWITFPFVLILIDYWPLQRFKHETIVKVLIDKLPFLVFSYFLSLILIYSAASTVDHITNSVQTLPLYQRISNIPVIYIKYLLMIFYPADLPNYYPYPRDPLPLIQVAGSSALILALTAVLFIKRKKVPHLLVGWLWFLGTLFPVTGLFSAGESVFIANRWTYLPHIGLFAAIIWQVVLAFNKTGKTRGYLITGTVVVLFGLSLSSFYQTRHWRNSETYWQQALRTSVDNNEAHYMLGTYYLNINRTDMAIQELEKAFRLMPSDAFYALMLGRAYAKKGDIKTAWHYFNLLLKIGPPDIKLLTTMGQTALASKRLDTALEFFQAAIDSPVERPQHYKYQRLAYLYAGHVLVLLGSADRAKLYFEDFLGENEEEKSNMCQFAGQELLNLNSKSDTSRSIALLKDLCRDKI